DQSFLAPQRSSDRLCLDAGVRDGELQHIHHGSYTGKHVCTVDPRGRQKRESKLGARWDPYCIWVHAGWLQTNLDDAGQRNAGAAAHFQWGEYEPRLGQVTESSGGDVDVDVEK